MSLAAEGAKLVAKASGVLSWLLALVCRRGMIFSARFVVIFVAVVDVTTFAVIGWLL
jgi:hypothetical protein